MVRLPPSRTAPTSSTQESGTVPPRPSEHGRAARVARPCRGAHGVWLPERMAEPAVRAVGGVAEELLGRLRAAPVLVGIVHLRWGGRVAAR